MRPPARAIAGHLIWSTDGPVWALWRAQPFAHAYRATTDKLATHARIRALLIALPKNSMLLSICERLDRWDLIADMVDNIDLRCHQHWAETCEHTARQLTGRTLSRRRHYIAAELADRHRHPWRAALRHAADDVTAQFGLAPRGVSADELDARHRQARSLETSLRAHIPLERTTTGETRWLYARAVRRSGSHEPPADQAWQPAQTTDRLGRSVLAPLTDVVIKEGGYRTEADRPHHRRYVRVDHGHNTSYLTALAVADMPHEFTYPGGAGEWLHHLDDIPIPIDWCVRIRSVPNPEAQAKVRRQQRQLIGQVDEYDGETTGAPPSLAEAIAAVDGQRAALAANPIDPELQATIIFSVAATSLSDLEDNAAAVAALFEPHDYGIYRPTGGQTGLLRSMLPGTTAAPVCRDYTQFLLPGDLAGGAPLTATIIGDPTGLLLGDSLDTGTPAPVLFDPGYGPQVGRTASLAAIGALGSGKSYLLKRLCSDTIARGGQIVTIDRTTIGEYATFADVTPGRTQLIHLTDTDDTVCLDPLRTFTGDTRTSVTLGLLSLLAGTSTHSDEGAALAEAVRTVANQDRARLRAVIDELHQMATGTRRDTAARSIARRLDHYQHIGLGRLAFSDGPPVDLTADLTVFWAPHLALPDRQTLVNEHLARQILPEEVLGLALLYLVAAVGRHIVFFDPGRFGAALYDEAWALVASPHGQRLLLEGVRDGRKHNGAIWLATQHPTDLGTGDLVDLLGARFVFHQAPGAISAATAFLGVPDSDDATEVLRRGLPTGRCLYRDVRDRIGLIDIAPHAIPALHAAADTTPQQTRIPPAAADTQLRRPALRQTPLAQALATRPGR